MILIGIFNFGTPDCNVLKDFSLPPLYAPLPSLFPSLFKQKSSVLGCRTGFITHLYSRAEGKAAAGICIPAKLGVRCALVVGRCFTFSQDRTVEWGTSVPAPKSTNLGTMSPTCCFFFCILLNHLVLRIQPLILKYIQNTSRATLCKKTKKTTTT